MRGEYYLTPAMANSTTWTQETRARTHLLRPSTISFR